MSKVTRPVASIWYALMMWVIWALQVALLIACFIAAGYFIFKYNPEQTKGTGDIKPPTSNRSY